jgi:nicotinamidase/pyrazinamidase
MKRQLHLLIIDPQNDFCDLPAAYLPPHLSQSGQIAPALPVPGAHQDMQRIAQLIQQGQQGLGGISITLDTHHILDIAHPGFWQQADGGAVQPFTSISAAQVRAGTFQPRNPASLPRVLHYLDTLEATGRYSLLIWPVHCAIGSWGHNVHADVYAACQGWQAQSGSDIHFINKGSNPWTEHYSALMAEVPDPNAPETLINQALLDQLAGQDRIYICGEAGSHCVKATTEHIVQHIGAQHISKLVLLTDCISPVTGFDAQYQDFLRAMQAQGVEIASSSQILPELLGNIA